VEKELDEAERLASEHKEFASALSRIKEIRNSLSQTRSLLGGLPFGLPGLDFDEEYDEDDDEFDEGPPLPPIFSLPKKKKKKRK
jgi:hypothetical protein